MRNKGGKILIKIIKVILERKIKRKRSSESYQTLVTTARETKQKTTSAEKVNLK